MNKCKQNTKKKNRAPSISHLKVMAERSADSYVDLITSIVPVKYRRAVASLLWWDMTSNIVKGKFNLHNGRLRKIMDGFDDPFTSEECAECGDYLMAIGYPQKVAEEKVRTMIKIHKRIQEAKECKDTTE